MPHTDGRNSRASDLSRAAANSKSMQPVSPNMGSEPSDTVNSAGVVSMLKTGTDTGDIGALSFNKSRLPIMPRPTAQPRRGNVSRPSSRSSYYATDSASNHYAPSASTGRRGSLNSTQSTVPYFGDTPDPTQSDFMPSRRHDKESRSYSLTMQRPERPLSHYRSKASVKSQGHEPTRNLAPPATLMADHRHVYGVHGNRAGHRPPSPAFSDFSQGFARGAHPMPRPPPRMYYGDHGPEYRQDGRRLSSRTPSHGMSDSPVSLYDDQQRHHQAYHRNGYAPTGDVGQYMRPGSPQRMAYHPMHGQGNRRHPPPVNPYSRFGAATLMSQYAGRYIPRSATPRSDSEPPSSDPPSSGTVLSSSNPSTPQDGTPIHVFIDPAGNDPRLPDSTSEPALPAPFFDYAEEIAKGMDESEADCHTTSMPPSGFVQMVRAMLESRAASGMAAKHAADHLEQQQQPGGMPPSEQMPGCDHQNLALHRDVHELAAQMSPRVTLIDSQGAVELSASSLDKAVEVDGARVEFAKPLTRALVRAVLSPTPSKDDRDDSEQDDGSASRGISPTKGDLDIEFDDHEGKATNLKVDPEISGHDSTESSHVRRDLNARISSRQTSHIGSACCLSGAENALHFSVPVDTSALDETHSTDPFSLDADTITFQTQSAKQSQLDVTPEAASHSHDPVSPLQAGEDVTSQCAVSPLHSRTTGSRPNSHSHSVDCAWQRSMPGAFPEDTQSSSESRVPRSISKSLPLTQPATPSSENAANRHSLPPDLSPVGESTANSSSGLGDVDMRFPVPPTTSPLEDDTTSANVAVEKVSAEPCTIEAGLESLQRPRGRSIIVFKNDIAALEIAKKPEPTKEQTEVKTVQHDQPMAANLQSNFTQSDRQPTELRQRTAEVESTTGLRFSGINFIRKFTSTRATQLKEVPRKDIPIPTTQQSQPQQPQPVVPAHTAAVKAMQERTKREAECDTSGQDGQNRGRALNETRDLPSLNFSCMDLFDQLNDALEVRSSSSIDITRRRDFSGIYCPSPQRLISVNTLRERYASFFDKPEVSDMELDGLCEGAAANPDGSGDGETLQPSYGNPVTTAGGDSGEPIDEAVVNGDERIASASATTTSPTQDFLSVASQINRLSIPSVSALSDRLSDILSGKSQLEGHLLDTDQKVQNTIDDIHQIGQKGEKPRPQTMLSSRTSAGFRTLAERAEEFVRNGHHDSHVAGIGVGINKDLPSLPHIQPSNQCLQPLSSPEDKTGGLPGSASAVSDPVNLPTRPASALIRSKSPETEEEVRQLLPPGANPITRKKRSLVVSSLGSRPWNQDENYPWASTNITIDLAVPRKTLQQDSLLNEMMRERDTQSLDVAKSSSANPATAIGDATGHTTTTGIDIGSLETSFDSNMSVSTEQCTGVPKHERKHGTPNIVNSLTKRIGLSRSEQVGTTKSMPASLVGLCERPHNPGERYPSTGLTPPTALNLDEVRSFFSDDSSEMERRHMGRKRRLASIRKIRGGGKTRRSTSHTQSLDGLRSATYDAGSINERGGTMSAGNAAHMADAAGMGRAEFTFKRFGEKLRHL